MMRKIGLPALALVAAMLVTGVATADDGNAGSTYLDVFAIGVGARPAGMAGYHAAPGDLWSLTYNPSGLANIDRVQVGVSAVDWLMDSSYTYLGVGFPSGEGALALGLAYFDLGSVSVFEGDGDGFGETASAYNFGFIGGYGFEVPSVCGLKAGVTGQVVQGSLDDVTGTALGVNLGVQYGLMNEQVQLGGVVKNLGTKYKFAGTEVEQTLTFGFGGSYATLDEQISYVDLLFTVDAMYPQNRSLYWALGGEVWIYKMLALRAGYKTGTEFGNFGFGAGFRYSDFQLDYTYGDYKELQSTHRISLSMAFGG